MERVISQLTGEITSFTVFATAFLTGIIMVIITKRVCHQLGISDQPDGRLKIHEKKVVSLGGIPIFISLLVTCFMIYNYTDLRINGLLSLTAAATVILGLGVYDDVFQIKPFTKLCFQTLAALIIVLPSTPFLTVDFFGIFDFSCGIFAIPIALFWIIGSCNAFNFIDGMDGLAAGVSMIICLSLAAISYLTGNTSDAILSLALAGSLASILVFNYNPASIFLGDSGSQLTGMLIGVLTIRVLSSNNVFQMPVAYTLLSLPVLDTFLSILRRVSTFRPIYQGDLSHIHHCVKAKVQNVKISTVILWGVASLGCMISLNSFYINKYASLTASSIYHITCFILAVKIGCLSVHKLLYRFRINIKPATAVDRVIEIEALWERMKPLFEKIRLDRAIMTLEGINEFGRPEYKTLQWVRNEHMINDFPTDCWTTKFYLDPEEREMVILKLQSIEKHRSHEEKVNWLLNRISSNMKLANSYKKNIIEQDNKQVQKENDLLETVQ